VLNEFGGFPYAVMVSLQHMCRNKYQIKAVKINVREADSFSLKWWGSKVAIHYDIQPVFREELV